MKTNYIVKVTKDAMTGMPVAPSLMLTRNLAGFFGEVVFTGTRSGAIKFLATQKMNHFSK